MLRFSNGRKVAVMISDTEASAVTEDTLRLTGLKVNYVSRECVAILHRGVVRSDGSFQITDPQPLFVGIEDMPETTRPITVETPVTRQVKQGDQTIEIQATEPVIQNEAVPANPRFTQLITPLVGQTARWAGDFRQVDIETIIKDNSLLPGIEITEIIPLSGNSGGGA